MPRLRYYANSADLVLTTQNVASDQGEHCLSQEFKKIIKYYEKFSLETPKTRNGLTQMKKMDKSTAQKGANVP